MGIDMNAPATRQDRDDVLAEIRTMADGMYGALQQTRSEFKGEISGRRHDVSVVRVDIDSTREVKRLEVWAKKLGVGVPFSLTVEVQCAF